METKRDSQYLKESLENWMGTNRGTRRSDESYDEYLMAMKRVHHHASIVPKEMMSPRARYRQRRLQGKSTTDMDSRDLHEAVHISTIASMVPDEIVFKNSDYSMRSYETALMFIDVSGFTDLCEMYTKAGRGGPSKLTQVLNSYIGAMVQEILTHNGDVLKFAGDAFLSMWKKTSRLTMQDVVHTAIDCGLIIQKNYGTHVTDLGVTLKVKVAISAGVSHFAIIGDENMASYVIIGQPVWDAKAAEYMSTAGDVLTSASAWMYVNEGEYCTQPCGDGRHTKVLGVGFTWKRVEKIDFASTIDEGPESASRLVDGIGEQMLDNNEVNYREFSLRPAVISALKSSWWPCLRRFMVTPVLRAVDNDEPMDFLTEVRHVVVVFLNIITKTVTEDVLIGVVDSVYKSVCSVVSESSGLVNKVSMFDKDMMFLVVFGLRGLKHEDEAQKALLCAFQLKETLQDPNITTVSIGVTSGRTYCGVVGHVLRREYTVIGSPVNKAARLMMTYINKVTCDKETFVRSKLDLDFFRLMEPKWLKGIAKPGPIYEFNKSGWPERMMLLRHPILGRNEEMRKYKDVLKNAVDHQKEGFTRYRDMQYGVVILGPRMVGKKRLMDEYLNMTPSYMQPEKITLTSANMCPYSFIRVLLRRLFLGRYSGMEKRNSFENRIRNSLSMIELTPLQIHAANTMFELRFPLPENFTYSGDLLSEQCVRELIYEMFADRFRQLRVIAVVDGHFIDDQSWKILLMVLESKSLFIIMTVNDYDKISKVAQSCISNNIFVKIKLSGIDRWYHAPLACQLLDVQAIPADLEKVMESASGGLPGWIQNFVISLIQRGELSVVTVPRSEAVEAGAVMPSAALLLRPRDEANRDVDVVSTVTRESSFQSTAAAGKREDLLADNENIQMAVLAENYNFDDMKVDMTMDVIILKTYDSLTPFEKMMLKCGAVLGDVFSRRMLLHLLQSDSPRKVSQAVAKLFEIRVLECEGGDFTRDTSMVLIHPAPATMPVVKPPYCCCLGTRAPPNCRDLPMYSFCGYMKFRHSLFRTTTYELLTENQKHEMHARALLYLERYTRRCTSCGAGCFTRLFGVRCDDGLVRESKQLKRVRQQISALSAETRMTSETLYAGITSIQNCDDFPNYEDLEAQAEKRRLSRSAKMYRKVKRVRSYSSLELENCECLPILLTVYNQVIDHCRAVGECEKLFETYLEYVDLSLLNLNIPQAIRLLFEVEEIVKATNHCGKELCRVKWVKDYRIARILTSRGACMLESGDYGEARRHLMQAMKLFRFPFPTTNYKRALCDAKASFHQMMCLYVCPKLYIERETGWTGQFYDYICWTLITLYKLFIEEKEFANAALAAKLSLEFSTKCNSTFRLLCVSYANMISIYREQQKFSRCVILEKRVMDICHRKRGQLDITEVHDVCTLYTSIFLFYVEYGKKVESLEFGLSVIPMLSCLPDITTGQLLVLWMLKLLLSDLRIHEMVMIMREFFYMTDHYDLSSETWYYYYAIVILLDTGYCVEQFGSSEKFYIKKGDAILRSKTPEAAWNFFACMWLVTIRVGAWERSLLWEEKIKQILQFKFQKHEFNIMVLVRVVEGFLIALVNEVDNRNIKKIIMLLKNIKSMFHNINDACRAIPMYRPRYFLLFAYYQFLRGRKTRAFNYLNKAAELCKLYDHTTLQVWVEHTRNHWRGTLNPKFVNYWAEHIEADNLLDYKDFDADKGTIIPYTLPLPRDFEK